MAHGGSADARTPGCAVARGGLWLVPTHAPGGSDPGSPHPLDNHSGVAPYLQLVQQVKQAQRLGLLKVGDQLPTVREVVAQITINPNTVLKAYRELEREGLVVSKPGQGTFVQRTLAGTSLSSHAALRRSLVR